MFLLVCKDVSPPGQMTDLLFVEKKLVLSLKDYIREEETRLDKLRLWADRLASLSSTATTDAERFLGNPVNAFKLIKRLNSEWSELEALVLEDTSHGFISNLTIQRQHFPTDEDQTGAANALLRLQDVYRLDTKTIATGRLPAGHQRALGNLQYFEYQLSKQQGAPVAEQSATSGGRPDDYLPERKSYEKLCRGEGVPMTPRRRSRLRCRYHDNRGHPSLLIGPVKEEEEWDRPLILRYHDVVSEREIEKIKELAKPRLRRATVHDPQTGKLTTAPYRVSKRAPLVDKINLRIQAVTGLDVSTAEDLQVANYGVGGQYEPHFDFGRDDEPDAFEELGTGNRIATWLLYMSDVQAGGATVFTDVGAAITPKKGSAVFWYNLFPSGDGDYRTRHAACPVLLGNKWVSNKWIHERGQEFRRRCGLRQSD
uniref:procollagen-proline 4-dioxygenase n=1 Tax=Neogobius melanostomus TaxID=47308 RepID=A0A8C6TYA5_9GOBI